MLEGNPGRRPLPSNEPLPTNGVPTRPGWLLPEAKREWSRLAPELERLGLLTIVDRAAFSAYCQCWGMYVGALEDIEKSGTTFVTDKGYEGPRPSVGIASRMLEKMAVYGAKFGLSPSDRARLSLPEKPAEDPFSSFLNAKRASGDG